MLKKAFGNSKKPRAIKEAAVNKLANKKNSKFIRVGDNKAIEADVASIKKIRAYAEKKSKSGKDVTLEDIIKNVDVDYGDGVGDFKVIDVVTEERNLDDVVIVRPDLLRLDETTAIQGNPLLIKRAFEYVQANPNVAKNPQKIIKEIDEPVEVLFRTVPEADEMEERFVIRSDANILETDGYLEEVPKKETVEKSIEPQLHIVNTSILDQDVISEEEQYFIDLDLKNKYYALGILLENKGFQGPIREKIEKKRADLLEMIGKDVPRAIKTDQFEDFMIRKPPLNKKFNPFANTVPAKAGFLVPGEGLRLFDDESEFVYEKSAKEIQDKAKKTIDIKTKKLLLEDEIPLRKSKLREVILSEMIDAFTKLIVVEKEKVVEKVKEFDENRTVDAISKKQFVNRSIQDLANAGEIVNQEDLQGKEAYEAFNTARQAYKLTSARAQKEELLTRMTSIIEWNIKRMYPNVFAVLPLFGRQQYDGLFNVLQENKNPSSFEVKFLRHLQKNLDRIIKSTKLKEYAQIDIEGRMWDGKKYIENMRIETSRLDKIMFEEIKNYLRVNIDEDYIGFLIRPPFPRVTQEQLNLIDRAWEEISGLQKSMIPMSNAEKDVIMEEVEESVESQRANVIAEVKLLETNIFNSLGIKTAGTYISSVAYVLQFLDKESSKNYTVGPYANTYRERILLGDLPISSLHLLDFELALPEFSMNKKLSREDIRNFVLYSQHDKANKLMNFWVYTQTLKQTNKVWFSEAKKPKFKPQDVLADLETMCGQTKDTVYVKRGGEIVCIPRQQAKQEIDFIYREQGDQAKTILNPQTPLIDLDF